MARIPDEPQSTIELDDLKTILEQYNGFDRVHCKIVSENTPGQATEWSPWSGLKKIDTCIRTSLVIDGVESRFTYTSNRIVIFSSIGLYGEPFGSIAKYEDTELGTVANEIADEHRVKFGIGTSYFSPGWSCFFKEGFDINDYKEKIPQGIDGILQAQTILRDYESKLLTFYRREKYLIVESDSQK